MQRLRGKVIVMQDGHPSSPHGKRTLRRRRLLLAAVAGVAAGGLAFLAGAGEAPLRWIVRKGLLLLWRHRTSQPATLTVRSIGWGHLDLSDLRIGRPENPLFRARQVDLSFERDKLLRGEIESMEIQGAWTWLEQEDGRWTSPLLPLLDLVAPPPRPGQHDRLLSWRSLVLRDATVELLHRGGARRAGPCCSVARVEATLTAHRQEEDAIRFDGQAGITWPGSPRTLTLSASGNMTTDGFPGQGVLAVAYADGETVKIRASGQLVATGAQDWNGELFLEVPPSGESSHAVAGSLPWEDGDWRGTLAVSIEDGRLGPARVRIEHPFLESPYGKGPLEGSWTVGFSNRIPVSVTGPLELPGSRSSPWLTAQRALGPRGDGWEVSLRLPDFLLQEDDPLQFLVGKILPLDDWVLLGEMGGAVQVRGREGGVPITTVQASLKNAAARTAEWQIENLEGAVELFLRQDRLRTTGEQSLAFGRSSIAGMTFDGGRALWQLDGDLLRVASAELDWLGGHLRAYALDVDVKKKDAKFVLYVDDVDAGRLLRLIKPLAGSGEGRLFGRFPVRLENGRWRLHTAYLYSMPGQEGSIRISDTRPLVDLLAQAGVSRDVRNTLADALHDFRFTTFALELHPPEEGEEERLLAIRLLGVSRDPRRPTPVHATLNLRGPLETLLNMGVIFGRMQD